MRFLARDRVYAYMQSALYAIARPPLCLSLCLSECHMGGSVKNGNFHHRVALSCAV